MCRWRARELSYGSALSLEIPVVRTVSMQVPSAAQAVPGLLCRTRLSRRALCPAPMFLGQSGGSCWTAGTCLTRRICCRWISVVLAMQCSFEVGLFYQGSFVLLRSQWMLQVRLASLFFLAQCVAVPWPCVDRDQGCWLRPCFRGGLF